MPKILRLIIGVMMIAVGLPGLILPIIPGTLLILAGILILSIDVPLIDRIIAWIEQRYPKLASTLRKVRETLRKRL